MTLDVRFDATSSSRTRSHEIELTLLLAVLLTALVCWLFLGSLVLHRQRPARHPHLA